MFPLKYDRAISCLQNGYQRFFPGPLVIPDGVVFPRRSSLIDFSPLHECNLLAIFSDTSGDILRQPVCFL